MTILRSVPMLCVFAEQHEAGQVNFQICWQTVTETMMCMQPLAPHRKTTYTECCCLYGEAWGRDCALCPPRNSSTHYTTTHTHLHIHTLSCSIRAGSCSSCLSSLVVPVVFSSAYTKELARRAVQGCQC